MSLLAKARAMFGLGKKGQESRLNDPLAADISVAVQRNERASENARRALEDLRMRDTLAHLAGKMK